MAHRVADDQVDGVDVSLNPSPGDAAVGGDDSTCLIDTFTVRTLRGSLLALRLDRNGVHLGRLVPVAGLDGLPAVLPHQFGTPLVDARPDSCVQALVIDDPLAELILVNSIADLLAGFLPVPGGMGVAEAADTAGLVALGVPNTPAMSTAIAFRMVTYYLPPIWGTIPRRWLRQHLPVNGPLAGSFRGRCCIWTVSSGSDRQSEVVGRDSQPPADRHLDRQFVVTSAEVLRERMAGNDDPGATVLL